MACTDVKTPIVYYGGKTAILNHILPIIPEHEVYTEVFFGGGAVFFSKRPAKNETINDKLDLVVNFYRVMQDKDTFPLLKNEMNKTLIGRTIHKEAVDTIKKHKKGVTMDPIRLAWAFWVCTNFAYSNKIGGGYKYSNHKSVSVPYTLKNRISAFDEHLRDRIQSTYIENEDALKVLESRNVPAAFHYIDPPYPGSDQGHYKGYDWDEYTRLLDWCAKECKGKFLLSNYNSELLDEYIHTYGWRKKEITHRIQAMNSKKTKKRNKTEVLVWNYDILPSLFTQNTPQ